MADDCIFCKIVKGEVPSSVVAQDERTFAFLDIRPMTPGHTLVIPKAHAAHLAELPAGVGGAVFEMGRRVAAAMRTALKAEGVNLYLADGRAAGQEVLHVHLHVIPRTGGDGFGLRAPAGYGTSPSREEMQATAGRIGKALK